MRIVLKSGALAIAAFYLALGWLWIFFSDQLTENLFGATSFYTQVQTVKGFAYVAFTSILLFFLVSRLSAAQKRALFLARSAEKSYRSLFIDNPTPMLLIDPKEGEIVDHNEKVGAMFFNAFEQLKGRRLCECLSNECLGRFDEWMASPVEEDIVVQSVATNSGERFDLSMSAREVSHHKRPLWLVSLKDVTSDRRYLRESAMASERFDCARQVSGLGYWEVDVKKGTVFYCDNVNRMLVLGRDFGRFTPLDTLPNSAVKDEFERIINVLLRNPKQSYDRQDTIMVGMGVKKIIAVHARLNTLHDEQKIIGTFLDVTSAMRAQRRLEKSEEKFRSLVELLPEGVVISSGTQLVYANQAAADMLHEESPAQLIGRQFYDFVHESDRTAIEANILRLQSGGEPDVDFTRRRLKRVDGAIFEADCAARLLPSEGAKRIQIVVRDMTDTLNTQYRLERANKRLSVLSSHTLGILEKERKRISGELHDDIGQSLTAIKLGLGWIRKRVTDTGVLAKVEDTLGIATQTLSSVRDLSFMLRPAQLDSIGLVAAVRWYTERLFSDSDTTVIYSDGYVPEDLDRDVEITAFRIVQECVTNVVRHAQATRLEIAIGSENDRLNVSVTDDGVGFDVSAQYMSIGLINMEERAEFAGGEITIRSFKNVGTEVLANLPLHHPSANMGAHASNQQRLEHHEE